MKNIGFAICGSFCTHKYIKDQIIQLKEMNYNIIPIMSEISYVTDTRFGKAEDLIEFLESKTGNAVIHTIQQSEPIGPKKIIDALVIAPCTGNTLGKLSCGITDTSVTMAAKANLRNENPLIIALSTNDALGASAKNIGSLLNNKNIYFVPFKQDLPMSKHSSCIADFTAIPKTLALAFEGKQIQPILL